MKRSVIVGSGVISHPVSQDDGDSPSLVKQSNFDISPPTKVSFASNTPRPYFLRGQAKYSSTPVLDSSPSSLLSNATKDLVVSNLESRLEGLVEPEEDLSQIEQDSGFETLNSEDSSLPVSPTPRSPGATTTVLGAAPKRRSPRHLHKNLDSIERFTRLTRLKPGALRSSLSEDLKDISKEKFASSPLENRLHFKYDPRVSCEGQEYLDIVRGLSEMNLTHILNCVFSYCSPVDLYGFAQVSKLWQQSLCSSQLHESRRLQYVAVRKSDQENLCLGGGHIINLGSLSPRVAMANISNWSPGKGKRERAAVSTNQVSPSKIRHRLFFEEGSKLSPGERLTQCPVCTSPSRVGDSRAQCSSPKCDFVFCPDCLCQEHVGRGCRVTRTGSKVPKSGSVTSKKSKARLRRL